MEEITQAQAQEFREVSALVCMDLDVLADCAEQDDMTLEMLKSLVKRTHEMKEDAIHNPESRRSRYEAGCLVFSAAAAGLVRCDPVTG